MRQTAPESSPARLVYLANIRLPSDRAHVLQIFKNCEAFGKLCLDVHLVHPGRRPGPELAELDPFEFYDVERSFEIEEVRAPDLVGLNLPDALDRWAFVTQAALFTIAAARRYPASSGCLLYTRDFTIATLLSAAGREFIFELHSLPSRRLGPSWLRWVSRRALGTVVISRHLAEDCLALGVEDHALFVAPDAVDRRLAERRSERSVDRSHLGLPGERTIAAYTGHLGRFYAWKGLGTVLECARRLPEVLFLLVGGSPEEVADVRVRATELGLDNVRFEGWVPPPRVARYLGAADVLLLPNSAGAALSARHTSPMKAFEYLASGRAIIASDLPSLREIYEDEVDALLVPADDPDAFAAAIRRLESDPSLGERLGAAARAKAKRFGWEARAEAIVEFARRRGARLPAPATLVASAPS